MADIAVELTLDHLSVTVPGAGHSSRILTDASFSMATGEVVAVVGPSGSGKSTLLKAILGLVPFTAGRMAFRSGVIARPLDPVHRRLRQAAEAVFQNPMAALNPHRTLRHTLEEPLVTRGLPAAERRRRGEQMAARMGLSGEILDRRPAAVSLGQAQRAAIARALAPQPALLFLDEPLSALDAVIALDVAGLLAEIIDAVRPTVVVVSHDLRFVRRIAHRVIVLGAGRIVEDAPVGRFLAAPASEAGQALVASDRRRRAVFEAARDLSQSLGSAS